MRRRRKDDLFLVESTEVPRPDDVCARLVPRVVPAWGFAIYGVLYFLATFVIFTLGLLPGYLLGAAVGAKGALWVDVLGWTMGLGAFGLAWYGFARWVMRKRAGARALVRDGQLVQGRVIGKFDGSVGQVAGRIAADLAIGKLGARVYRVAVEIDGTQSILQIPITGATRPAPGAVLPVLLHRGSKHALVFAGDVAQVARVR